MKAYRAHRLAGPQGLVLEEAEEPKPGSGEVVIGVEAVGLELADLAAVSGERRPRPNIPFTPGLEVAGRIVARGARVRGHAVGSPVTAFVPWGGLAERVVTASAACVAIPENLSMPQAAALPFAYGGAFMALDNKAGLKSGQSVLVLGAGGHAGLAAVAVAKAMGAVVIAVASGAERLSQAKELGADHIVDAGLVSIASGVEDATKGKGVDVVYDPVGGEASSAALSALSPEGLIVSAGFASGKAPVIDAVKLFSRGGSLLTANTVLAVENDPGAAGAALARVVGWVKAGRFVPRIAAQFSFAEMRPAFDYVAGRRGAGAVIVKVEGLSPKLL
jgi:NADPH:quinone reductase